MKRIMVVVLACLAGAVFIYFCVHTYSGPVKDVDYTYRIVNIYPHDPNAFTQGLVFENGFLYEGTGLRGSSSIRKVELETGTVLQLYELPPQYFGEGITIFDGEIIQLTWQSQVGFVYDVDTFELVQEFTYPTEGWGITHDGTSLIMSDGTATLHYLDPETFAEIGRITVRDKGELVSNLNELEYVQGEIYANVWQTDWIARIAPDTGDINGWIYLEGLLPPESSHRVDVLNGIAYDTQHDRLFVTGKLWPKLFEIELIPLHSSETVFGIPFLKPEVSHGVITIILFFTGYLW